MRFCTWYDSCAVVACAKFCSDMMSYYGVTLKPYFPLNLNYDGKIFREMGPRATFFLGLTKNTRNKKSKFEKVFIVLKVIYNILNEH